MSYFTRAVRIAALFCVSNLALLVNALGSSPLANWIWLIAGASALLWLLMQFYPVRSRAASRRVRILVGGHELLVCAGTVVAAQSALYLWAILFGKVPVVYLVFNTLFSVLFVGITLVNGFFRVVATSTRLRILWRVLLLTLWWVPGFNLYLFYRVLRCTRDEHHFALARQELDEVHEENADCRTKYPLMLVHGIFFRDWQHINYWGRIPQALQRCGASIYYGRQQSAAPVAQSAEELKAHILEVLQCTGAEKVNIIAHSKGGLDSRYAISKLDLGAQVASLTTVNTPHRGVVFARHVLEDSSEKLLRQMESKYNAVFKKLGDKAPDFMGGVRDLTDTACKQFNEENPDDARVLYQSVMTTMRSPKSAGFPLNLTWKQVKKYDGEANDGLVARSSAPWGSFLGEQTVPGKRGISHGDVIDLLREDIAGFDVREFYIDLVRDLKAQGL